ncbi:MAG: LuxR C-terminal-related transcriptional regulator, partial [Actinoplanes sp.]
GRADAARLLAEQPGASAHAGARLLLAQAAGNPLALTELARHLPPEHELAVTSTELPVPARLRRALAPMVDALGPVRLRGALLAAFAAETPGPAATAALDVLVSPDVWAWLVADGVLRPGRGRRFTHPVVRAAVIDQAGHAQSRDARHQLAALLPAEGAGGMARAWHTARADPAADERVAALLDEAGDELTRTGRLRSATYAYSLAAARTPDPAAARDRQLRARHSAHLAGEPGWVRQMTIGRGEPAPAAAGPVDTPELAPLLRHAWLRGDEESRAAVRSRLRDRPVASELLAAWARAIVEDADPAGTAQRLLHEHPRPGRTGAMAPDQHAMVLGTIALARHETELAVRHLLRAQSAAPPDGLHFPMALSALAGAYLDGGDPDTARQLAAQTVAAIAPDVRGGPSAAVLADIRVGALAVLASVAVLHGTPDRDDRVRDALGGIDPVAHALHHARLLRAQGLAAAMHGDHELAFRRLRRLFHPDGRPVHHRASDLGLADLAQVAVVLERADEVRPLLTAADERVRTVRAVRTTAIWHRAAALLAGPDEGAESYFRLALADPGTEQWPVERALTRLDYAQWLRRRQRPGESRPLLGAARDVFAAAGLTALRERAEAELEAAAPPPRPGAAPAARLTPQQRQVVALAAQGLTNPQIAARLGLSARTVGIHLSRAYPILGVTRRTQLPQVELD